MRYVAQNYTVEVPFSAPAAATRLEADFHHAHDALYGFATDEEWIVQGIRVQVSLPSEIDTPVHDGGTRNIARAHGTCWFTADAPTRTPRFEREGWFARSTSRGPPSSGMPSRPSSSPPAGAAGPTAEAISSWRRSPDEHRSLHGGGDPPRPDRGGGGDHAHRHALGSFAALARGRRHVLGPDPTMRAS